MSDSSSSSDSEASSSEEDIPQVTTHTERVIRRYQIKKSLIMERIFAIDQDNENLIGRIIEAEHLVKEGISHRKSIMSRLDTYGDDYRSVPVLIPSEAEVVSAARSNQTSTNPSTPDQKVPKSGKKRKHPEKMGESVGPGGIPIGSLTPDTSENPNKKQSRDPRMPKRPHNAFFYFCQERRPNMQKEFPHLTKKEIAALLNAKWTDLPHQEKAIYLQLQTERKKQYQAIMAQYNEALAGEDNQL